MINLTNKKVLFIGTSFFDYDDAIIRKLKEYGATVFYFSSALTNIKKRFYIRCGNIRKAQESVAHKLTRLIEKQPKDVDYIFIIKADNFLEKHILLIKRKYPSTPIVLYLWDSIRWLYNRDILLKNFNTIYTFDRLDAEEYHMRFRPLFFRDSSISIDNDIIYDVTFVGSLHTERFSFLKKIVPQLKANGLKYKFILRGGRFSVFWDKYVTKRIKRDEAEMFVTSPISYSDYLNLCTRSNVILDIANPMQVGLTMRTIELLGMNKKILTTNKDIINYGLDTSGYSVIDIHNPIIDVDFLRNKNPIENDIRQFTLGKFIEDIFDSFGKNI